MALFLTSNIGCIKDEEGIKTPVELSEQNNFLNNLKELLKSQRKFVLVASDPDNYEANDMYLQLDKEALKLSGLVFDEYLVLDGRNKGNVFEVIGNSDLVFLSGGNTLVQNKFLNETCLGMYLKNPDIVTVGISAGAINSAEEVFITPKNEEDINNSPYKTGLELTKISVEPHFVLRDLSDSKKVIRRNAVLKESFNRTIIALTDGAYILEDEGDCTLYGEGYKIKNGSIINICKNEESINLDDIL